MTKFVHSRMISDVSGRTDGSVTWDPGVVGNGQTTVQAFTFTGAAFGDYAIVAPPYDMQSCVAAAYVDSADSVTVLVHNASGGSKTFSSGSWKVRLIKA